jgi:SAM-dependent methyltransferase
VTLQRLGPSDAAVLETFVVPRYLTLFGESLLDMFLSSGAADVVHLGCRTGYPDELIADRRNSGSIVGLDPSSPAIELARTKGALIPSVSTDYDVFTAFPTALNAQSFTHGICLHPSNVLEDRQALIAELARLIVPQGQVLLSLPMRGFQEIIDLCASTRFNSTPATSARPPGGFRRRAHREGLTEELRRRGFDQVDVDLRPVSLAFRAGAI